MTLQAFQKFDAWHKTRLGRLFYGVAELAFAYVFVSLAIDRGNLLYYVLTLVFTVGGLQNLFKLIGLLVRDKQKASQA